MARLDFRGGAAKCTASGPVGAGATSITLAGDTSGWPTGASGRNFMAILDRGVAGKMEKILCSDLTGGVLTIATRGYDGTTGIAHDANCTVEHGLGASVLDDLSAHMYDDARDDHSQYSLTDGSRPFSDAAGITDVPVAVGTANAEGTSDLLSRADHVHDIADNAVGQAQMADDSVGTAELIDASIQPVHLANGALGGPVSAVVTGGPTSGTTELTIATLSIPAQPFAYTLDAAVFWSGLVDTAGAQYNLRVKVDGTTKAEIPFRNGGGNNIELPFAIPCITPVAIAASTACTVTVTIRRTQGTGTIATSIAGVVNARLYTKVPV